MNRRSLYSCRLSLLAVFACGVHLAPIPTPLGPAQAIGASKPARGSQERFTDVLPPGAREIDDAIRSAKTGEEITLRGRIPDTEDAFADGRAVFALVDDAALKDEPSKSADSPGEAAATPAGSRANIQFVDAAGNLVRESLRGKRGLKPGAEVFVIGVVDKTSSEHALVVNARSIHVPRNPLPAGFFKDSHADGVKDVSEARAQGGLKVGDRVVLRGRIGGSAEPFVDGRAIFTLMGRELKACNENPDDKCAKPWDYCCEPKEAILANSATVQVVDDKGSILKTDIKGRRGIKELSEVVVVGTVVAAGKALVVNADEMSVAQP